MQEVILSYLQAMGATPQFLENRLNFITEQVNNPNVFKTINEPTLIFSDVHGNFPALQAALNFAEQHDITSFISLGDMLDYNPYEKEVLESIFSNNKKYLSIIKGNHDRTDFGDGTSKRDSVLSELDKEFGSHLINLPDLDFVLINDLKILLCHSNPYSLDPLYLLDNGQVFNEQIYEYFFKHVTIDGFFYGHSHFVTFKKSLTNNRFAFNPGSLGFSRDGSSTLTFCVIHPEEQELKIYGLTHQIKKRTELLTTIPELNSTFTISKIPDK